MSSSLAMRFPHLDHFLNAYMHQDWELFGDSLEDVVQTYASDTSPVEMQQLRDEIVQLLTVEGHRIETSYYALYPNSVMPSGWGMSVADWLTRVANLANRYTH